MTQVKWQDPTCVSFSKPAANRRAHNASSTYGALTPSSGKKSARWTGCSWQPVLARARQLRRARTLPTTRQHGMARRVQVILLGEWWNTKTATCSPRPCPRCAERCGTVILRCPTESPCTVQSGPMHFQTLRGLRARLAASAPLHHASQRSYTARTNRCICAVPFAGRVLHLACRPLHIARCMRLARSVLFAALERVAVPAARFGPHSGGGTFTQHSACHSSHVTFHL